MRVLEEWQTEDGSGRKSREKITDDEGVGEKVRSGEYSQYNEH